MSSLHLMGRQAKRHDRQVTSDVFGAADRCQTRGSCRGLKTCFWGPFRGTNSMRSTTDLMYQTRFSRSSVLARLLSTPQVVSVQCNSEIPFTIRLDQPNLALYCNGNSQIPGNLFPRVAESNPDIFGS